MKLSVNGFVEDTVIMRTVIKMIIITIIMGNFICKFQSEIQCNL